MGMIADRIDGIIVRMEDASGGFFAWSAVFVGITFLRAFLEGVLEESQTLGFRLETLQSLEMAFLHSPLFYLTTFTLASLILSALARTIITKTTRVILLFSPVILVAPIVDALIRAHGFQLHYFSDSSAALEAMVYTFCPFTTELGGISPGMRIEVFVACVGGAIYLWAKRRHFLWAVAGFTTIYLVALFAGYLPALFTLIARGNIPENGIFVPGGLIFSDSRKYALVHLLFSTAILSVCYFRAKSGRLGELLGSMRPVRSVFYLFATGFGLVLGAVFLRDYFPEFVDDPFLLPAILSALAGVFFIFQSQLILNDHYDREIDLISSKRTYISTSSVAPGEAKAMASVMFALSLLFAAVLSYATFLIALASHVVGFLYSAYPFRLKRIFPLNTILIAVSILLAVLLGFSLFAGRHTLAVFPHGVALFLLATFAFVASVKDIPDSEGDRRGGVTTIATLMGARRAGMILATAVIAAYFAAPFLLEYLPLLFVSTPAGVLSAIALLRGREFWVFVLLFVSVAVLGVFVWNGDVLRPETGITEGVTVGEYFRGVEAQEDGDFELAQIRFNRALDSSSNETEYVLPELLTRLGKTALAQDEPDLAYDHFIEASRSPNHPEEAYAFASGILWSKGNPRAASDLLTTGISLRPRSARLRLARGKMGIPFDYDGALMDLQYAYKCRLERDITLSYLGDLSRLHGKLDTAMEFYGKALSIEPKSIPALAGLAEVSIELGDAKAAIDLMLEVSTLLEADNRSQEADRWLKRAARLKEEDRAR
jgi:4-hydroxybenzoate polyprenyltransferase